MSSCNDDPNRADDLLLSRVVEGLCSKSHGLTRPVRTVNGMEQLLPSRAALIDAVEALRSVFFPGYFGISEVTDDSVRFHVGATLDRVRHVFYEQVRRGLCFAFKDEPCAAAACAVTAHEKTNAFLERLPEVRRLIAGDVQAAYDGDPAATYAEEPILCYPGIQAITSQRLAHELYRLEVPLLPRIITEHAHSLTGIDIHPGASIGERFFIDHGTGVVIGETSQIGHRVRIYQGVTLGAKSFPLDEHGRPIKGIPRHPIVEDDVVIYGGATILGRITIGRGSVVGGNVWLTRSLPPGSKITQAEIQRDVAAVEAAPAEAGRAPGSSS